MTIFAFFKIPSDITQTEIDVSFSKFYCRQTFRKKAFYVKSMSVPRLIFQKKEVSNAKLNKIPKVIIIIYSATGRLGCIYSVSMAKNNQKYPSRCFLHEFSFHIFSKDISLGYRTS